VLLSELALRILSDQSIDFLASEWAQVEDTSLNPIDCRQILEALRRLAGRAKFGKRLFLWNSTLSADYVAQNFRFR